MANIIFDFDGTIADSLGVIAGIFAQLNHKTRKLSKQEVAELRGLPILTIAHRVGIPAWQIPFLLAKGRRQMSKHMSELKTFDGIKPLVERLQAEGHHLFVLSTNSSPNIRKFLHTQGLAENFQRIYGGIGLFNKPRALRQLIKRNRLQTESCFYVCDESRDIEAAKEAKVHSIAVAWGFANANHLESLKPFALAQTPSDIAGIIKRSLN